MSKKLSNLHVLFSMSLAVLFVCIEYTGMPIITPAIAKEMVLSFSQLQWVVISYLLTFALSIVVAGKIGDIYGNKQTLAIGVAIFGMASFIGGISHVYHMLIASRLIQGLAAAMIWPNATAVVINTVAEERKPFSIGVLTGVVGISMAAGPAIAGLLANYFSWRWFFLINVPFSALMLFFVFMCPKLEQTVTNKYIDMVGIGLFSISLFLLIIAISAHHGMQHRLLVTALFLMSSILLFILFFKFEKTIANPFIHISILTNRFFISGCISRILINMGFYSFIYIMSLYLNNNMGFSLIESAGLLLPMTIAVGIASPIGGRLIRRYGEIPFISFSCILFAITYLAFIFCQNMPVYQIMLLFILPGLSYGLISPALILLSLKKIKEEHSGTASGIFYMSSLIGSLIGILLSTSIIKNDSIYKISHINFTYILLMCCALSLLALTNISIYKFLFILKSRRKFS